MVSAASGRRQGSSKLSRERVRSMALSRLSDAEAAKSASGWSAGMRDMGAGTPLELYRGRGRAFPSHLSHSCLRCGIGDELAFDANLEFVRPFSRSQRIGRHTEVGGINVKRHVRAKSAGENVNLLPR
jgi:hypothetical protein